MGIDDFSVCANPAYVWDDNGNTTGSGSNGGDWNQNKWTNDVNGATNTTAFTNYATPVFAAGTNASGTYTVNVNSAVNANGITFEEGNVTLGASTGTLTLSGATLNVANGATGTIAEPILSTIGLTKTGLGTLTLTGNNIYTGTTTISQGILSIGAGSTGGAINNSSNITNNAGLIFNRSDAYSYSGIISGTGTLTKQGAGTLTLFGDNTYSGATTISAGTLSMNEDTRLGTAPVSATAGHLTINGGTLNSTSTFEFNPCVH
jgi:autotransporter-associated beta strand protein